jgi:hypothetical protein
MKNLIFILIACLQMSAFGQSLGNRIEFEYGLQYLSFKEPIGCNLVAEAKEAGYIAAYLCNSNMILFEKRPMSFTNDATAESDFKDPKFIQAYVSGFESSNSSANVYDTEFIYINEKPALKLFYNMTMKGEKMKGVSWYIAYDRERLLINSMHPISGDYKEMSNLFSSIVNSIRISYFSIDQFQAPKLTMPEIEPFKLQK